MSKYITKKTEKGQHTNDFFEGKYFVWKKRSETLAELLTRFRDYYQIKKSVKLTYAGRLDPMAEGLVLILAGQSRFQKELYLNLPKTYIVEIMIGVSTDSLDVLGLIENTNYVDFSEEVIENKLTELKSINSLSYPLYSSAVVGGKPLFLYARTGKPVVKPKKKIQIFDINLISIRYEELHTIVGEIINDIKKVKGDFRQNEIIDSWQKINSTYTSVPLVKIKVTASSGTYMRSLADLLGKKLGTESLAYTIARIAIGENDESSLNM